MNTSLRIIKAMEFAAYHHRDQKRYAQKRIPYASHVSAVGAILARNNYPEHVIVAGILHDVIEDTPVTFDDIVAEFGMEVAELVASVSENTALKHADRKVGYCDQLRESPAYSSAISAADWIANISTSILSEGPGAIFPGWYKQDKKDFMKTMYLLRLEIITEKLGHENPLVLELNDLLKEL